MNACGATDFDPSARTATSHTPTGPFFTRATIFVSVALRTSSRDRVAPVNSTPGFFKLCVQER